MNLLYNSSPLASVLFVLCVFLLSGTSYDNSSSKMQLSARRQWLMPVILTTQEAEIRRIAVQSQSQANTFGDPILKKLIIKKEWQSGSTSKTTCLVNVKP
jgi:predicted secreted acid phosphatase